MTDTEKAALKQKMEIAEAVKKVKKEIDNYDIEIKKQTGFMSKLENEILSAEKKMTEALEGLIRKLREHEREMKAKFREIYEAQRKHLATGLDNFEVLATQLKSCAETSESILQRNSSVEILQTNQAILGRCEQLLNIRKPKCLKPPHVCYILEDKHNISDRIVPVSKTDPSMSSAERQSQERGIKEKTEANFTIVTRDSDGLQCYEEHDQVKVEILSPRGNQLKTKIKDTKDGKYTVTYTPQCAGQHTVEIQINGQPLTGSPWVVQAVPHQYQFVFQFGSAGKGKGEFMEPIGITVNERTGTIAVADRGNKRIQMFRSDWNFLREIKLENEPAAVAFTKPGDLILFNPDADKKLLLFNEEGEFIRHIKDEQLQRPFHISVAGDGRIIACDWADNKIKVLSADGKDLLQSFTAPDCDSNPYCAVCNQDKIFVSYHDADCVKVFNSAGVYQCNIGCQGSGDGQLRFPTGLVIDKFNHLIVCDLGNKRLQIVTLDGKFLSKIQGRCFDNSYLCHAAVSATGYLFVTDFDKNCIYLFE